jgi:hypothetical protein
MDLQIADTVLQYRRHVPLPAATEDGTFSIFILFGQEQVC